MADIPSDALASVRPTILIAIAGYLDSRSLTMLRPDSQTYAEWQTVVAELRRLAAETQPEAPWATDSARIGRALIWSWSSVGNTSFGQGYQKAQEDVRAILTRPLLGAEAPAPETQTVDTDRIVAYRSPQGRSLYCTRHVDELFGAVFTPVTSDDLPDGGLCTFPDCGADVLIPQDVAPRCPAKHGALGRICELPKGHAGMHTGSGESGAAVWDGDAP